MEIRENREPYEAPAMTEVGTFTKSTEAIGLAFADFIDNLFP